MKTTTVFYCCLVWLAAVPASAQTITSLSPARNQLSVPRTSNVALTISGPTEPGMVSALKVFSAQAGGKKAGVTSLNAAAVSFDPSVDFKAGETVMATFNYVAGASQVWQFTTAVSGGNGTFGGGSDVPTGTFTADIATGDIDGDGDLDIVAGNSDSGNFNGVFIRLNNGSGSFSPGTSVATGGYGVYALKLGDIDNDGDLDIVCTNGGAIAKCLFNNGSGSFSNITSWAIGDTSYDLALGDLDGDGDLDFVASTLNSSMTTIRFNDGTGNFGVSTTLMLQSWSLALGDADGDGDLDLWVPVYGNMNVLSNNGAGSFSPWRTFSLGTTRSQKHIELADMNGDGILDMLVGTEYTSGFPPIIAEVRAFLNNGTGTFSALPTVSGVGAQFSVGDLDADGDLDLVTTTGSTINAVCIRLNNGLGSFSAMPEVLIPDQSFRVALGDVDGDGDLDLLARTFRQGGLANTIYPIAVRMNANSQPTATATAKSGDFNAWPNPVPRNYSCHVALPASGKATYRLLSVVGQLMRESSFADSTDIPMTGLASGVYLLTVQIAGHAPLTQRIVVE